MKKFSDFILRQVLPVATVQTDASRHYWGAALENRQGLDQISGRWSPRELSLHINNKELLAILNAIQHFLPQIKNHHITIFSDNRTAVSVLQKQGCHRNTFRHSRVSEILQILDLSQSSIEVHHIPGRQNILADLLSRQEHIIPSDLQISSILFGKICKEFGLKPQINLFATYYSKKCTSFTSSIPYKDSVGLNAFTLN